jgi:hypothetical protein
MTQLLVLQNALINVNLDNVLITLCVLMLPHLNVHQVTIKTQQCHLTVVKDAKIHVVKAAQMNQKVKSVMIVLMMVKMKI